MKNRTLHITCAIDDSYVYPLAVLLVSIFENHKQHSIKFHLCSAAFNETNIKRIEDLVCKRYSQQFAFYPLDPKKFENFRFEDRFSLATYYRLLVADTIDESVDRFLHLDADMIVVKDISELFDLDFGDKVFAATNDITAIDWKYNRKQNIPDEYLYFNSGTLLVDRKKWVDMKVFPQAVELLAKRSAEFDYVDQDALNCAMYKYRFRIGPWYNQQIGMFVVDPVELNAPFKEDYLKALRDPSIIHYNGTEKPWIYYCAHPLKHYFEKYAEMVKDIEPPKTKLRIRKLIRKYIIYQFIGWKTVNRYYYYKTKPQF
jgi:lipopolysaccharide biosynthesis glycosyltransferase